MSTQPEFSVLMVTYAGDDPAHLRDALQSPTNQTRPAKKICLVCAGPLTPELDAQILAFEALLDIQIVRLPENQPLGLSLNAGLRVIETEWVARMDSDDLASPQRFERQFDHLARDPEISILGTSTQEFATDPEKPIGRRDVPLTHDEIIHRAFLRSPFNHMTVVYKKSEVVAAGGYQDFLGYEDFELWTRMLTNGSRAANLADPLVKARVGNGFHARRGGLRYALAEWRALAHANKINKINPWAVRASMVPRFLLRLMPTAVRNSAYSALRK